MKPLDIEILSPKRDCVIRVVFVCVVVGRRLRQGNGNGHKNDAKNHHGEVSKSGEIFLEIEGQHNEKKTEHANRSALSCQGTFFIDFACLLVYHRQIHYSKRFEYVPHKLPSYSVTNSKLKL